MKPSSKTFDATVSLTGRTLLSLIFVVSGLGKLADPASTLAYIEAVNMPMPVVAFGLSVMLEIIGGLLLIVGFKTRPTAILLASFSLVTAAMFHNQLSDPNQFVHFLKNVSMTGGLLLAAALGSGAWSFDQRSASVSARSAHVL